jgi:hypothetical protein
VFPAQKHVCLPKKHVFPAQKHVCLPRKHVCLPDELGGKGGSQCMLLCCSPPRRWSRAVGPTTTELPPAKNWPLPANGSY